MSGEAWLTKQELAERLRCSVRTVERLRIPIHQRVGGQNRYLLSEARAFLDRRAGTEGAEVVRLAPREKEAA